LPGNGEVPAKTRYQVLKIYIITMDDSEGTKKLSVKVKVKVTENQFHEGVLPQLSFTCWLTSFRHLRSLSLDSTAETYNNAGNGRLLVARGRRGCARATVRGPHTRGT
jgi:hypothetical protein